MTSDSEMAGSLHSGGEIPREWSEPPEDGIATSERTATTVTAVIFLVIALTYSWQALSYSVGTPAQPGPGLFPIMIGALFVVAAVGLLVETRRGRSEDVVHWPYPRYALRLVLVLVASVLYLVLLPIIGQLLAGALLCALLLIALNMRRWWVVLIVSVVSSVTIYVLFSTVLGVPLPRGPFDF